MRHDCGCRSESKRLQKTEWGMEIHWLSIRSPGRPLPKAKMESRNAAGNITMEGRVPTFYTIQKGAEGCLALIRQAYSRKENQADGEFLRRQEGLFMTWSDSIGALGGGDNSLEYKLRNSPNIHFNVLKALESLAGRVQHYLDRSKETLNELETEVLLPDNEDLVATQPDAEWEFDTLRQSIERAVTRVIEYRAEIAQALLKEQRRQDELRF